MTILPLFARNIKRLLLSSLLMTVSFSKAIGVAAEPTFGFDSVLTLEDMSSLIHSRFPLGTSRSALRQTFVEEGHATLRIKPDAPYIEKYIFDINLCNYYIWRWNISADYDESGRLLQAYVNGNSVFQDGTPKKIISKVAKPGTKASIYQVQRPRPEAYKGEKSLAFMLFDGDSDQRSNEDQTLIGAGPSRADPTNMGKLVMYSGIDPWRSIFDFDPVDHIVAYSGSCERADKIYEAQKQGQKP
jgi:hypothetical protein